MLGDSLLAFRRLCYAAGDENDSRMRSICAHMAISANVEVILLRSPDPYAYQCRFALRKTPAKTTPDTSSP